MTALTVDRTLQAAWAAVRLRVVIDEHGCHMWPGAKNSKGYGSITLPGTGQTILVHRLALLIRDGAIPAGHVADHTCHDPRTCTGGTACRHRLCVNPEHLEPVTVAENSRRGAQQNRATCKRGHLLGFRVRRGKAVRCCRRCEAIDRQERRACEVSA